MSFLDPIAFLYLLAVPPVVLLYFLRLRRKNRVVPSTLLWQNTVADLQANAPFQRLRRSLLLILQVLLLLLLAGMIARPFLRLRALSGASEVLILDGSASMAATDERPSRLAAAQRAAARIVGDLSRGDEACVLLAGDRTRVLQGFTSNHRALQAAIDRASTADTETRLRDALALAVSLAKKRRGAEIVLISDGAFGPLEDFALSGERLRFVRVGKGRFNVGVTAMDARRDYSARGGLQVFVQITSFAEEPTACVLELYRDDSLVDARPVQLAAQATRGEVFADFPYDTGALRAHLDLKDDLAADNDGYAYLLPRRELSVLLVSDGNLFLQKALEVDPHVQVTRVGPKEYTGVGGFKVTVFDGWAPPRLPDSGSLLVRAAAENAPVRVTGAVQTPTVVRWNDRHPVTRHAAFEDIAVAEALAVSLRPWGQTLVEGDTTPLVVCGQEGKVRAVYLGFQVERSNLPLRAAFPILIQNCLQWLAAGEDSITNRSVKTGDVVPLEAPAKGGALIVTGPGHLERKLAAATGTVMFDETGRAGVYRARSPSQEEYAFAANLLSAVESDIHPRGEVTIGDRKVAGGEAVTRTNREIWRPLALLALLILGLEWYAYHRRI